MSDNMDLAWIEYAERQEEPIWADELADGAVALTEAERDTLDTRIQAASEYELEIDELKAQRDGLLAACKAALRSLGFYLDFHHQPHFDYGGKDACRMLHAAIAAAKGEDDDRTR